METAVIIPVCSRFPPAVTAFSSHVNKVLRFSLHSFIETYSNIYNILVNPMLASHTAIQSSRNEHYQHGFWRCVCTVLLTEPEHFYICMFLITRDIRLLFC